MSSLPMPKQVTLATLGESSAQEVFNWIVYNLLKQNRKSIFPPRKPAAWSKPFGTNGPGGSAYRGRGGDKCAAGWLMLDSEYRSEFEKVFWSRLVKLGLVPAAHNELIYDLQKIHDTMHPSKWWVYFSNIAEKYNLSQEVFKTVDVL